MRLVFFLAIILLATTSLYAEQTELLFLVAPEEIQSTLPKNGKTYVLEYKAGESVGANNFVVHEGVFTNTPRHMVVVAVEEKNLVELNSLLFLLNIRSSNSGFTVFPLTYYRQYKLQQDNFEREIQFLQNTALQDRDATTEINKQLAELNAEFQSSISYEQLMQNVNNVASRLTAEKSKREELLMLEKYLSQLQSYSQNNAADQMLTSTQKLVERARELLLKRE